MYTIKLNGGKELQVEPTQKEKIIKLWNAYHEKKENKPFSVDGEFYKISDVRSIEKSLDSSKKLTEITEFIRNEDLEYQKNRKAFLSLPIEQKVTQSKSFMEFAFTTMSGNKMPEDKKPQIKKILLDFFTENPKRMYPDMTLFKNLMEYTAQVKQTDTPTRRDEAQPTNPILVGGTLLRKIIGEDIFLAEKSI